METITIELSSGVLYVIGTPILTYNKKGQSYLWAEYFSWRERPDRRDASEQKKSIKQTEAKVKCAITTTWPPSNFHHGVGRKGITMSPTSEVTNEPSDQAASHENGSLQDDTSIKNTPNGTVDEVAAVDINSSQKPTAMDDVTKSEAIKAAASTREMSGEDEASSQSSAAISSVEDALTGQDEAAAMAVEELSKEVATPVATVALKTGGMNVDTTTSPSSASEDLQKGKIWEATNTKLPPKLLKMDIEGMPYWIALEKLCDLSSHVHPSPIPLICRV